MGRAPGQAQSHRDQAEARAGHRWLDELTADLDDESPARASAATSCPARRPAVPVHPAPPGRPRPPRRPVTARTIGRAFTAPDGKAYRPSMFLTLTCDSYGKVREDGTPADPDRYDYRRAARDALHFPALFDRLIQNLRRFLGYDLQYFAAVEPQRRLAPHVQSRSAAPCPALSCGRSSRDLPPGLVALHRHGPPRRRAPARWHAASGSYIDPETGEFLPTWDQALDAIGTGR